MHTAEREMANPGEVDKYGPLIIPNCQPTASQEVKLQSCPFVPASDACSDGIVPSSSSSDDAYEQATAIEMLTLPDSSDEYQTPPEYRSCSQNSSNDGQIPAIVDRKTDSGDGEGVRDDDGEGMVADERKTVDLGNEMDDLGPAFVDSSPMVTKEDDTLIVENNNNDTVPIEANETEVFETEVIGSMNETAHEVFAEMPEREQAAGVNEIEVDTDINTRKRKVPFAIETKEKNNAEDQYSKHELFKDSLIRVLKMLVGEEKCEVVDANVDFLETAKMRGMTFPRPQWWPPESCEDQ